MLIKKILIFILVFCITVCIREGFNFFLSFRSDKKLEISTFRLIGLGLAISYIATIIFTGFSLR